MMECKSDCLFNIDGKCTRQNKKDMTVIEEWKNDFKSFINELSMPEDDYNGIMEYIDELPVNPQEPKTDVLDKIRAEIADLDDADYDYEGYYKAVIDALQVIDKYRQEG